MHPEKLKTTSITITDPVRVRFAIVFRTRRFHLKPTEYSNGRTHVLLGLEATSQDLSKEVLRSAFCLGSDYVWVVFEFVGDSVSVVIIVQMVIYTVVVMVELTCQVGSIVHLEPIG